MINFNISMDSNKNVNIECDWEVTDDPNKKLEIAKLLATLVYSINSGMCYPMMLHAVSSRGILGTDEDTAKMALNMNEALNAADEEIQEGESGLDDTQPLVDPFVALHNPWNQMKE